MRLRSFVRLLTIAMVLQAAFGLARAQLRRAHVDERAVATLEDLSEIYLEVQAGPQDNYVAMALRYAGSELSWAAIENANGRRPVVEGRFYGIPFDILSADWRARAIQALFPQDGPGEEGWVHRVPDSDDGQPLQKVAIWFTGDISLADDLAETNGIDDWSLPAGGEVVIPAAVLLPRFLAAVDLSEPPAEPAGPPGATRDEKGRPDPGEEPAPPRRRPPAAPVRVGDLTFHDDPERPYAVYRLKAGEALYSSVVVRFTGRLDPEEVNQVAGSIAQLSGISRPTSIPIGFPVRIPRDLVLPEYLPPDDPQRIAYEADLAAAGRHRITVEAKDLHGVTLILDAGHGGDDVGARRNGVHEDDYVYDILCRIKEVAERTTGARVFATIKDRSSAYKPLDGPFRIDRDEMILTTPAYHPRQPHVSTAGVNLRWYLVNSIYRTMLSGGVEPQRVVFVSIHADSLHPSVRGAMVYVPGQAYRGRTYGFTGQLYDRKEVREFRYVKFSRNEKERAEGLSRRLAGRIMESFAKRGLPIHKDKPIRDHVIRGRRTYTPAVIRTSLVPQSLLLEVVNLGNEKDAALIKDPAFRQQVAEAFMDALRAHYSVQASSSRTTARGR